MDGAMEPVAPVEKVGIKETQELIALVQAAADAIKAAKADGEINWRDVPKVAGVLVALKAAVQGGNQIKAEMADVSKEEAQELMQQGMAAVISMVQAFIE